MRWWIGLGCCAVLAATGCCSSGLEPGVELRITEEGVGPHTEPIAVRYRIDDGTWTEIDDSMSGCAERTFCQLGFEMDGSYEIVVSRGPATVTIFVDVVADRCHVVTEHVTVLIPEA